MMSRRTVPPREEISPFVKADDAIVVDSTKLTIEQVVDEIIKIIKTKKGEK